MGISRGRFPPCVPGRKSQAGFLDLCRRSPAWTSTDGALISADLAVDNRVQHHHNGAIVVTLLLYWRVHSSNQSNRSSAATTAGRSRKQSKRFKGLQGC